MLKLNIEKNIPIYSRASLQDEYADILLSMNIKESFLLPDMNHLGIVRIGAKIAKIKIMTKKNKEKTHIRVWKIE
jgi:hypothetical protein